MDPFNDAAVLAMSKSDMDMVMGVIFIILGVFLVVFNKQVCKFYCLFDVIKRWAGEGVRALSVLIGCFFVFTGIGLLTIGSG